MIEIGTGWRLDGAKAVKDFRMKAVTSTAPLLTTVENEESHDLNFYEKLLTKSNNNDGCLLFFSFLKEDIIGMVGATFDRKSLSGDSHVAEVKGMFVSAKYRHQNLGSRLMSALIQKLSELGITNVILEVLIENTDPSVPPDLRVVKFYEKLGFVQTGLSKDRCIYKGSSYNLVHMQKLLNV